jgi:hypothetical protein
VATASTTNADDIRRKMAQIRVELHQDVQGLVAGTEAASDWKYYVRHYPWAAIGAAALVGFLIVPRKRRSVTATAHQAAEVAVQKVVEQVTGAVNGNGHVASGLIGPKVEAAAKGKAEKSEKSRAGLFGLALGFAGPILKRLAQTYVTSHLETFLAQQGLLDPSLLGEPGAEGTGTAPKAAGFGAGLAPGGGPRPGPGMSPPGAPPSRPR